jgi:cation/acetate symporter
VLLGEERGMSVTQSIRGSASGYEVVVSGQVDPATGASLSLIADTHINFAFFPLDNPGIVSIPLAFFLGWLGSVTGRQPSDPARFARIQVRALTGVGAERGGHN